MKKIIGLTGPTGAGKSTISNVFAAYGAYIIDADRIARRVTKSGSPALLEIKNIFGDGVIMPDGELNRSALAKIVFNSEQELHKLNMITHKYIIDEINREAKNAEEDIVIIDAAALFESGADDFCDKIVCITASEDVRKKRIMMRDGISKQQAEERIHAQKNDDFYVSRSDYHIENNVNGCFDEYVKHIIKEVCSE